MAYNAPHWPLHAPDSAIAKYKGKYDKGYQAIRKARYERMVKKGIIDPKVAALHPQEIVQWASLSAEEKTKEASYMEVHAAMLDVLDYNIGQLLDKLKAIDKFDNTLIVFFADNGASHERTKRHLKNYVPTGEEKQGSVMTYDCIGKNWAMVINTPFAKHKMTSYEGGICTPMIAHWPLGIKNTNSFEQQSIHLVDMVPTFVDLAQASYPKKIY